uniref:Uncharacterized protein n=1 Tax=Arundo donax TaxID=35708 RepID=A0A0A9CC76_ARUDO
MLVPLHVLNLDGTACLFLILGFHCGHLLPNTSYEDNSWFITS